MFIFVFQWTPAVSVPGAPNPPYGTILATFMVTCMLGSRIFNFARRVMHLERVGQWLLFMAAVAHAVPACFMEFNTFEVCVGCISPRCLLSRAKLCPRLPSQRCTISFDVDVGDEVDNPALVAAR